MPSRISVEQRAIISEVQIFRTVMAQRNRLYGVNRRLLSGDFYLRLPRDKALAILDAHERELRPWLEGDGTDKYLFRGDVESRRLLRDKVRRIERLRAALSSGIPKNTESY